MKAIVELTATLLLACSVLAAPLEASTTSTSKSPSVPDQSDKSVDTADADDFSDLINAPPLGERDYEVGILTPPMMPPAWVHSCLLYNASRPAGSQVFAQRVVGQPAHVPCDSSAPEKFTRETILAAGWVRFWHTKVLVPVSQFARDGSSVLARDSTAAEQQQRQRNTAHADRAALAVERVGGTWTQTPSGMATAGAPRQRFTFELTGRVRDRREPQQHGKAMYDVREGEKGDCLQLEHHYDGFSSDHRGGHAVEELAAFVAPCAQKEFSWIWTEIPKEVYRSVMPPPEGEI
jgi:hypothetical protein